LGLKRLMARPGC